MLTAPTGKYANKLTRKEAAKYLGVSEGTLAVWASTGRYPIPFIKIGRKVFYTLEGLDDFQESRLQTQTQ